MTKRFQVTKPLQVTKRRCALRMPMGIDGADSKGKVNDKEVCGDAAAVRQRRCEALRRRAAAVQEHLDKIKPVAMERVGSAPLLLHAAARVSMKGGDRRERG